MTKTLGNASGISDMEGKTDGRREKTKERREVKCGGGFGEREGDEKGKKKREKGPCVVYFSIVFYLDIWTCMLFIGASL